jgi:quinol monooxygenase YgiN
MAGKAVVSALTIHGPFVDDFMSAVQKLATESRKEDGCLRFDLLRDRNDGVKFLMYLLFKTQEDFDNHIKQPYVAEFDKWIVETKVEADVPAPTPEEPGKVEKKEIGVVAIFDKTEADTISVGEWAFQKKNNPGTETAAAFLNSMQVKPDRMDDFLKAMEDNATKTRAEDGCLRFDVLQSTDPARKGMILRYELFKNDEATDFHLTTDHSKAFEAVEETGLVATMEVPGPDGNPMQVPMQSTSALDSTSIPGGWALQCA